MSDVVIQTDPADFGARLRARVEAARARERGDQGDIDAAMTSRLDLEEALRAQYRPVHHDVIHPVVEALAGAFDTATITQWSLPRGFVSQCRLARHAKFSATARLTVTLEWGERGGVSVIARRDIVPVQADFEGAERLAVDAYEPDHAAIRSWLEARVEAFADACLRIARDPFYLGGTVRMDPVCGMEVWVSDQKQLVQVGGRGYAFCSTVCRARFEANPDMYAGGGHA